MNGRCKGSTTFVQNFPVNDNSILKDPSGNPISPIQFYRDWTGQSWVYSKKQIPFVVQSPMIAPQRVSGYNGTSGGNALPESFETTVLPDTGYLPIIKPPITGWTKGNPNKNDPTTYRDSWLEAAITITPYKKIKYVSYKKCQKPKCKKCQK